MFVCPHCGMHGYFEIITDIKVHLHQKPDGKFSIDLDFMSELFGDMPFAFTGKVKPHEVEIKIKDDWRKDEKIKEELVVCMSDECNGKEYKVGDLLLSQEERVTARNW